MPHYPDQRLLARLTTIRREALLPIDAVGTVTVAEGQSVDIRQTIARGVIPARHFIIDTRPTFGKQDNATLKRLLLVKEHTPFKEKDPIMGKDAKRGKRLFAPLDGIIVYVGDNRLVLQEMPEIINIEAGVRGTVTKVYENRGVALQATGAQIQGVWGNGRSVIALMRMEPSGGLDKISVDQLDTTFKGEIIVTTKPISATIIRQAEQGSLAGLIAPSMSGDLLAAAQNATIAIMLTEGFGAAHMSNAMQSLLQEFDSNQVTLNAALPGRWETRRPEIIINRRGSGEEEMTPLDLNLTLKRGMRVRISRAPYTGEIGKVVELPETPVMLENGLRVVVAVVELVTGDTVEIPLANLEFAGR